MNLITCIIKFIVAILNEQELARKFRREEVSQRECAFYILLLVILCFVEYFVFVFVTLITTFWDECKNGTVKRDIKHIIKHFAISSPVAAKGLIATTLVIEVFEMIKIQPNTIEKYVFAGLMLTILLAILCYYGNCLWRAFKLASPKEDSMED